MEPHRRWAALLDLVGRDGRIEVLSAAEELGVSAATIRRDLDELAGRNLLARTRGGAVPAEVAYQLPLRYKAVRSAAAKARIGLAAAALVPPGSVVGISGGTTTSEVARALAARHPAHLVTGDDVTEPGDAGRVTVVTNALNIAAELAVRRTVKLVVTGGVARQDSYELIGPFAQDTMQRLHLDIAVLGADGVDPAGGVTSQHEGEAAVTGLMATRADRVVVVADATKLGRVAFAQVCSIAAVDTVVTDSAADPALVRAIVSGGASVMEA